MASTGLYYVCKCHTVLREILIVFGFVIEFVLGHTLGLGCESVGSTPSDEDRGGGKKCWAWGQLVLGLAHPWVLDCGSCTNIILVSRYDNGSTRNFPFYTAIHWCTGSARGIAQSSPVDLVFTIVLV